MNEKDEDCILSGILRHRYPFVSTSGQDHSRFMRHLFYSNGLYVREIGLYGQVVHTTYHTKERVEKRLLASHWIVYLLLSAKINIYSARVNTIR